MRAIESGPLRPYYLLHGDDPFLVERTLGALRPRLTASGSAEPVRVVWGDDPADRIEAALTDLVSPSLFARTNALVIRRAEALKAADDDAVTAVLPRLGEGARLVLVAKALDQRRKLHAACAKAGAAIACGRLTDARSAATWVGTLARERGHTIASAAVELLVERIGFDLGRLDDEVEKLSLHVGSGVRIEASHVERLVAASRAHAIEELTDRLARRDVAGALRTLRGLVGAGEPPLRVLAFLAANLRRALHVSELAARGLGEDEIAARLGMPAWLVGRQARRGSPAELEAALAALAELDLALKSSRPEEATFEASLLGMTVGQARGPGRVSP